MSQMPPDKERHWYNNRELFLRGLARSNYVTAFEDWMMGLAGKLVNIVLIVTVLYSCAEIYVSLPADMNATMFLIQMAALDIGGYGLATLARLAKRDGDEKGAQQATWLGRGLITVMLVSVVIAGLEQKVAIPDGVKTGSDLTLIVIRSACSVFYGKVVHALKADHPSAPTQPSQQPQPEIDIQQLVSTAIGEAVAKLAADQQQLLADLTKQQEQVSMLQRKEQQELLTSIQEIQQSQLTDPEVSTEEIVERVFMRLQTVFLEQQEAIKTPLLAASKNTFQDENAKQKRPVFPRQKQARKTEAVEIAKRSRKIDENEVDAVVWPIKEREKGLSHRKIAPMTPYSETVVYSSLKRWQAAQPVVSGDLPETEEEGASE